MGKGGGSKGGGRHNRNPSGTLPSILGSPFVTADSSHLTLMRLKTYRHLSEELWDSPTTEYTEVITHPGKVFCTGLLRPTQRAGPVTLTTSLSERSFLSDYDVSRYTSHCLHSKIPLHKQSNMAAHIYLLFKALNNCSVKRIPDWQDMLALLP